MAMGMGLCGAAGQVWAIMKIYTVGAVSLVLAASGANGCTSSTGSTSSGSSSGGSSGSSGGGIKQCPAQGQTDCPQSEVDAYAKCATDNCDAEYEECYGAGYQSGTFGGPCASFISCANACACDDTACRQKCTPDSTCNTCNQKLAQCITSKCALPCQGETKTCDDLAACCAKIADESKKASCESTYDAVKSQGDVSCNSVYQGYADDGK